MTCGSTAERRRLARALADEHDGVLSRALLRTCDVDHAMVRREVAAERWAVHGHQTVAMTTAPLSVRANRWLAVWETGPKVAALDGVSALQHAGLTGFEDDIVHISVKHTAEVHAITGVRHHKVIRRLDDELITAGLPRTRVPVAAVRAAHWARSDRQAALLLVMPVQQRLCTGAQLVEAESLLRGRNRRKLIHVLVQDVADGAHSLGELDVVAACRRRGLPAPTRQQVRRLPDGKAYLDIAWREARLVVEVDGVGHVRGLQMIDDEIRQNAIQLGDELVLRVSLVGWRLTPEAYLDQICAAYWARAGRWS
jgi:very-short-patch-repair endonuclease